MEYYKDVTHKKKDRRIIGRKGPRDLQRQQQQVPTAPPQPVISSVESDKVIQELRTQVSTLLEEIAKRPVAQEATGPAVASGMYTAEEFDKELIIHVEAAIKDSDTKLKQTEKRLSELKNDFSLVEKQYLELEKERDSLRTKLESKDEIIASKEETIESLRLRGVAEAVEFVEDPDRPSMEDVFIDPNEKGEGDDLESHITLKEETDAKIGDQVNKLKGLIGGLPK